MSTDRLKELLQAAVELELATIPPYLCALYSMRPVGNEEAKLVIRSVVVEEMLHMVLAANVLNAIGGEPRVTGDHAPRYPHELPERRRPAPAAVLPRGGRGVPQGREPGAPATRARSGPPTAGRPAATSTTWRGASRPGTGSVRRASAPSTTRSSGNSRRRRRTSGSRSCSAAIPRGRSAASTTTPPADGRSSSATWHRRVPPSRRSSSRARVTWGRCTTTTATSAHYYRFQQLKHGRAYLRSDDAGTRPARRWRSTTTPCFR